ncbi:MULTISPECIES: hypothetical protein [unclassified Endozoicomonas]|uniref:hypothetical protein n=1 Tax=unclassified Endozoicomonas TaxID=2644528 RepID=UPI003BB578BB
MSEGKCIEDAFWEKKPLQGRQITSSDVLAAYGNDKTSLRGGLFLQKLCLQKIPHDNRKVTPDDVIQEFNRVPDQNNESMLAIEHFKDELASAHAAEEARLKVECYLRGDVGKGLQVTKDEALAAIEFLRKEESFPLPLARFKSQFSLRDLARHGQRAAPVAVQRDNPFRMPGNEIENTSANQRYRKSG